MSQPEIDASSTGIDEVHLSGFSGGSLPEVEVPLAKQVDGVFLVDTTDKATNNHDDAGSVVMRFSTNQFELLYDDDVTFHNTALQLAVKYDHMEIVRHVLDGLP